MALATPPMDVYPMAWLGMVALAWVLADEDERPRTWGRMLLAQGAIGLVFGFGTNLVALRFISAVITRFTDLPSTTGPLAVVVLSLFEASRWFVAAAVRMGLSRLGVPRAPSFAVGVYLGTFVPTMIPWTVACGACPWPAAVQLADVVGERGVAMLMALEAALVAEGGRWLLRREQRLAVRSLGAAAALLVSSLIYGAYRIHQIDAVRAASPSMRVGLVASAVPETKDSEHSALSESEAQSILARMTALTRRAEVDGAELVVWPEAGHPYPMPHVSRHAPGGAHAIVQPPVRGPILTGLMMTGDFGTYNSAVLAQKSGLVSDPYDKVHLLWFGEFVPFADTFPWLREVFGRGLGFKAGEHSVAMEAGPARIAVLICLEDILPQAGREAMRTAPNLLANVTNDSWFEGTAEGELHLRLAVLRAVETRRDLVRAVNGGPTTWIDAAGRVVARYAGEGAGVLLARPALIATGPTVYARWGDAPLIVLLVALFGARWAPRARRSSS